MAIPETSRSADAGERRGALGRALTLWPPPRDGWIAIAGVALIYGSHWLYGALVSDASMAMNIAVALMLGGALLSPRIREDLMRLKGLAAPGLLFAVVILVALWTLTPWTPGGPHPVWAYVGTGPGASTIDKSATTLEIIKLLGLACLFLVGAATGARDDRARYAIQLTLAVGLVFGLWAFITTLIDSYYLGRRLEAHFLNANTAGTVFAMLLMLAVAELARSLRGGSLTRRLALGSACLTFVICLFDTQSRSAVIAFLAGSFVFVALQLLTGRVRLGGAVAAVLAGIVGLTGLLVVAGDQLIDRLFRTQQDALIRSEVWKIHWQAFLASPLLGYGLGSAETVSKIQMNVSNYDATWNIRAILNVYLQWLEEGGLLGALPMFLCIAALVGLTARGMIRRTRMTTLLAGLLAIDVVVLVHGATDFALEVPSVAGFWAWLLGLQFSLSQGKSAR